MHEQLGNWGYSREQIELYHALLGKLNSKLDCICLNGLGKAYSRLGQLHRALEYYQQQLTLTREIRDRQAEFFALQGMGKAHFNLSQFNIALVHFQQQLQLSRDLDCKPGEIIALKEIGRVLNVKNNCLQAEGYLQAALALAEQNNELSLKNIVIVELGGVYSYWGKYRQGIEYLQQQLANNDINTDRLHIFQIVFSLGMSYCCLREYSKSIEYFEKAIEIANSLEAELEKALAYNNLGVLYSYRLQRHQEAILNFELALKFYANLEESPRVSIVMSNLSHCYCGLKQYEKALFYSQKALEIAERETREAQGIAIASLANIYWNQGKRLQGLLTIAKAMLLLRP